MSGFDYHENEEPGGKGGIIQFLALYLLVLAFFIVLVSLSTREKVRTSAVMDSLNSTFSTLMPPRTDLIEFSSREGNVLGAERFQEEIAQVFATYLQIADIRIIRPGQLLVITIPARSLFDDDTSRIRGGHADMLDRIAIALSDRPAGLRFDMEFMIESRPVAGGVLPGTQTRESERAGTFARELMSRGAPADSISIGLTPGSGDGVTIRFYVRQAKVATSRPIVPYSVRIRRSRHA